jgi:hypothetical protein
MAKRELIDTGRDKRLVRRNESGQFNESTDVGQFLRKDVKRKAKTVVKAGEGDRAIKGVDRSRQRPRAFPRMGLGLSCAGYGDFLRHRSKALSCA